MESSFNLVAYILLLVAVTLSLISLWRPNKYTGPLALAALVLSFASLTLALVLRSITGGRLPFATLYEFALLFAWGILLFYLISRKMIKSDLLMVLVALLEVIILSYSNTLSSGTRPLMPALQSIWLQFHVLTAIIAYGAFGLSFCLGLIYLLKEKGYDSIGESILPPLAKIDNLLHWSVAVGFPFMTLVLITGAVWAEEVWGRWWGWDPKETWALITWLIYAAYLHARKTYGWRGKRAAIMAIVGFLAVLFTLFGVSLLLPGAHSYV
ncbi:Cytochrome c biogenesis protein CcsA [Neomoorella glycerini]|uniref:Cytochrome c biogenesis protein CcsA n=1 Tax=Neomoorella glycerini TaxID=55779 RepID=A0A6I5ZLN2_9FIRM|nr:c-type cytochrome biogenesis protein CcsB [Moorella glycerini]QGP90716.1 Cytochrome c biogenesis protein CcsA [Moorella glycerini]